ncbi:MAG: hypothetical protein AAGF77_07015, partial [Bacteroidota bacterium]
FLKAQDAFEVFESHLGLVDRYAPPNAGFELSYHAVYTGEYYAEFRLKLIEFRYWLLRYSKDYKQIDVNDLFVYLINLFPVQELSAFKLSLKKRLLLGLVKGNTWLIGDWFFNKLNEEQAVVKIIRSVAYEDSLKGLNLQEINGFLDFLNNPVDFSGDKTLFETLYDKIQDTTFFSDDGKGNKGQLIKAVYTLWLNSKYNPYRLNEPSEEQVAAALDHFKYTNYHASWQLDQPGEDNKIDKTAAPKLLNYESERVFIWYSDNFNFELRGRKVAALWKERRSHTNGRGLVTTKEYRRPYGYYDLYQPISLMATDANNTIVKIPRLGPPPTDDPDGNISNIAPAFYLMYVDNLGDYSNAKATIGLIADIALTFTGIGNLTKLRHLKHLGLINRRLIKGSLTEIQSRALARALGKSTALAQTLSGALTIILPVLTDDCKLYWDKEKDPPDPNNPEYQKYLYCREADKWLFALEIASLSGDVLARRALRRATYNFAKSIPPNATYDQMRAAVKNNFDELDELLDDFTDRLKDTLVGDKLANINNRDITLQLFADVEGRPNLLKKFNENDGAFFDLWYTLIKHPAIRSNEELLQKVSNFTADLLDKLDKDLLDPRWKDELQQLLLESPADISGIWKVLRTTPDYAWAKRGDEVESRWRKWLKGAFFRFFTRTGKKFEQEVVLEGLKTKDPKVYGLLKKRLNQNFQKNLDDFDDLFAQVQLKYDGDNYFVADAVFVKYNYDELGYVDGIQDIIIVESKLQQGTRLSDAQRAAIAEAFSSSEAYILRNKIRRSKFGTGEELNEKLNSLKFAGKVQWYKAYDLKDGKKINDIKELDKNGNIQ